MSASSAEQCVRRYLREHGGTAPAGDVTAHATAAGHAASTVRRVADRIVTKTRTGNSFAWTLNPRPVFVAEPQPVMPSRPGRLIDVSRKPSLWDAMSTNGQSMRPDTAARVQLPTAPNDPRRERLNHEPEPEPAPPVWESQYARLDQRERLGLIQQRPTLADLGYTDDLPELTEVETIAILEADDDGLYELPAAAPGVGIPHVNLPY